jgi:hypothetical protein
VTGNGGPSGTGKRPTSESVLPPPVFIQDSFPVVSGLKNVVHSRTVVSAAESSVQLNGTSSNIVAVELNCKSSSSISSNQKKKKIDVLESKMLMNLETSDGNLSRLTNKKEPEIVKSAQEFLIATSTNTSVEEMVDSLKNPVETVNVEVFSANSDRGSLNSKTSSLFVTKDIILNCELSNDISLLKTDQKFSSNGVSTCAVFPVPISSFVVSVWGTILKGSSSDLMVNPYKLLRVPFSELLDLTLPPVDASCLTPWPKSLIYYSEETLPELSNSESITTQHSVCLVSSSTNKAVSIGKTGVEKVVGFDAKESILNQDKNLSSILALRQIFPTVNMNVGLPCSDFRSDS